MSEKITKVIPYDGQDRAALEGWLEDMARQGLVLKSVTLFMATFERSEPCSIRYRIDPPQRGNLNQNAERSIRIKELGWEYVTLLNGRLYKTADPNVEFPLDQHKVIKDKARFDLYSTIAFPMILFFSIYLIIYPYLYDAPSLALNWEQLIHSRGLNYTIIKLIIITALISLWLIRVIYMQFKRRSKEDNCPKDFSHTEQRAKIQARKRIAGLALLLVFYFIMGLSSFDYPRVIPLHEYKGTISFPLLNEINPDEWKDLVSTFYPSENVGFSENYLITNSNFLAPIILMTRQDGPMLLNEGGENQSKYAYDVNYYELVSKTIAQKVTADLEKEYPYTPITASPELKAMYVRQAEEHHLLMHYENIVISVWYIGSTDLRDCIPLFQKHF